MIRLPLLFTSALGLASAAQAIIPAPPELAAQAYVLIDYESGDVLVDHLGDQRLAPASLTKLMTSYVAEQELLNGTVSETETTRVSVKAWRTGGSRMFIQEGTDVAIGELLKGIIISSGNDASVAMAEHIAGTEDAFVDIMNRTATSMGLNNTQFQNATGFTADGHYSSAMDMALIASAIIRDSGEYYPLYAQREYEYGGISQNNRNWLLWRNPAVDGLKTGHTEAAGYNLVASAEIDGTRLIASVFGTDSKEARAQETQTLLSYGFRYYQTQRFFEQSDVIETVRVWGGTQDSLPIGVSEDVVKTIARSAEASLATEVSINPVIKAPVAIGEQLGTLTITKDGEPLFTRPLVAKEAIQQGGFFKRIWDAIELFFWNLFN